MPRTLVTLTSLVVAGAAIAGSVLAQSAPPNTPPPGSPSGAEGELQTPDRAQTSSIGAAATAPLHDLNITRQGIPPVLLAAITNPYDAPRPLDCAVVGREVAQLDAILGADFDQPDTPQQPSLTLHNGRVALALVKGASEMLLPFAGFVRTLSGAGHHDQLVIEAITAGSVRRGYLKGLGESLHCPPPSSPIHFRAPPPPAREDGPAPKYPIW
ncbi:MAG TPA: hypothetical protein VK801_14815 [Caulobacteraceae bacterium]|jgi:hypothetical protein|nr:hypothetical protein [Caulobacteraceae bacterium]